MIELFAFVTAALAFASRPTNKPLRAAALPALLLVAIAALGIAQLLPMPDGVLAAVSPASAAINDDANQVLALFNRPPVPPRISIAPPETKSTILLTLAYAAAFTSALLLVTTRPRRRTLIAVFLGSVILHLTGAVVMYGLNERVHGAFVNPNHFAGYLEIAIAAAFGIVWTEVLINSERARGVRHRGERLEKRLMPFVWRIVLWCTVAVGIALTRSRGAMLSVALTTFVLLTLGILNRQRRTAAPRYLAIGILAIMLAGGIAVAMTFGQQTLLRFVATDIKEARNDFRVQVWRASIEAWHMFPHAGSGLGTFREAFRRVQPREITGLVEQAHNDFLQILVTGGWIGAALSTVAFVTLYSMLLRGWRLQVHREESAFILTGIGALLSLTLHGMVDFNMSLPAIPFTLAIVAGASIAAAQYRSERDDLSSSPQAR